MTDLFITCSAGIGLIDETLEDLLNYMRTQGDMWNALEADILGTARALGLLLAYCMAAYYAWEMMLGRKGLDVMKLLRILAISFCITFSPQLCQALASPDLSWRRRHGRLLPKAVPWLMQNLMN